MRGENGGNFYALINYRGEGRGARPPHPAIGSGALRVPGPSRTSIRPLLHLFLQKKNKQAPGSRLILEIPSSVAALADRTDPGSRVVLSGGPGNLVQQKQDHAGGE